MIDKGLLSGPPQALALVFLFDKRHVVNSLWLCSPIRSSLQLCSVDHCLHYIFQCHSSSPVGLDQSGHHSHVNERWVLITLAFFPPQLSSVFCHQLLPYSLARPFCVFCWAHQWFLISGYSKSSLVWVVPSVPLIDFSCFLRFTIAYFLPIDSSSVFLLIYPL